MTPDQFKAWFEGFCEAIDVTPSPEQWAKIKAKVKEMRGSPTVSVPPQWRSLWLKNYLPDPESTMAVRTVEGQVGQVAFETPRGD